MSLGHRHRLPRVVGFIVVIAVCAVALTARDRTEPVITWNPSPVLIGHGLGPDQLNATASVPGTFEYSILQGGLDLLGAFVAELSVVFTPDDVATSQSASTSRWLSVDYWAPGHQPTQIASVPSFAADPDAFAGTVLDVHKHRLLAQNMMWVSSLDLRDRTVSTLFSPTAGVGLEGISLDTTLRQLHATVRTGGVSGGAASELWTLDADTLQVLTQEPLPLQYAIEHWRNPETNVLYLSQPGVGLAAVDLNRGLSEPGRYAGNFAAQAHLAVVFVGTRVYVADSMSGRLKRLDGDPASPTFLNVLSSAPYDGWAHHMVHDRKRSRLYVAGLPCSQTSPQTPCRLEAFHSITVFDIDANGNLQEGPPISLISRSGWAESGGPHQTYDGSYAVGVALSPDRDRLYVKLGSPLFVQEKAHLAVVDLKTRETLSVTSLSAAFHRGHYGNLHLDPLTGNVIVSGTGSEVWSDPFNDVASVQPGLEVTADLGAVDVTFAALTSGGAVTASLIDPISANLALPGQFSIGGAMAYEIASTAAYEGPLTLCFSAAAVDDPDEFAALRVLHGEAGAWVDRTASHDFASRSICASVSSLSPFALGRLQAHYSVRALHDSSRAIRSGATVPLKVQLLDAHGANVSSPLVGVRATKLTKVSSNATPLLQDAGHANPDGNFRYDGALRGYIFNMKTTGLTAGTYELRFRAAGDPRNQIVSFQIR